MFLSRSETFRSTVRTVLFSYCIWLHKGIAWVDWLSPLAHGWSMHSHFKWLFEWVCWVVADWNVSFLKGFSMNTFHVLHPCEDSEAAWGLLLSYAFQLQTVGIFISFQQLFNSFITELQIFSLTLYWKPLKFWQQQLSLPKIGLM